MTARREIRVKLDGDGMGPGSTDADAQSLRDYTERRLNELYPGHAIKVGLAPEGDTVSRPIELDETEHQDVYDALGRIWDEFCADTSLWPSTQSELDEQAQRDQSVKRRSRSS